MKRNAKKLAIVIAIVFLLVLAGPVVMNLALGTDSVGVISAAYDFSRASGGSGGSGSGGHDVAFSRGSSSDIR